MRWMPGFFSYSVLGGGQKRAIQETMERDAQKSDTP